MDNLIVMTFRAASGHGGRGPVDGSAEILFFTGVRYFREVDEAAFLSQSHLAKASPAKSTTAPRRRRRAKVEVGAASPRLEQQA